METPHDLFRSTLAATGDRILAIRTIRERFGLDIRQAKEIMLQAEGWATSLEEHQASFVPVVEQLLALDRARKELDASPPSDPCA